MSARRGRYRPTKKEWLGRFMVSRFLPGKSTKDRASRLEFENTFISASVTGPHTLRTLIEVLASSAQPPVRIESLPKEVDVLFLGHGMTFFKYAAQVFDQVAENFPNMYWWISDKGLNMAVVKPCSALSPFDELAGSLTAGYWKNGRLSSESLLAIARELDAQGFVPKDWLQPKWRKKIGQHNQRFSRKSVSSFEKAVGNSVFVRGVRLRLYAARKKFEEYYPNR